MTVMQREQEKVLSTHTHTICFSTCSSDPAHCGIPTGF